VADCKHQNHDTEMIKERRVFHGVRPSHTRHVRLHLFLKLQELLREHHFLPEKQLRQWWRCGSMNKNQFYCDRLQTTWTLEAVCGPQTSVSWDVQNKF